MRLALALLFPLLFLKIAHGADEVNPIQLPSSGRLSAFHWDCTSWRLGVEVNNVQQWSMVPSQCIDYVGEYMVNKTGGEPLYACDCSQVVNEALEYLEGLNPSAGGNDTWLFDLSDTLISTVEYYSLPEVQWGGLPFNSAKFNEWLQTGELPAVPAIGELYNAAKAKGFKIAILSGSKEANRAILEDKLKKADFEDWDELILKDRDIPSGQFKELQRKRLFNLGYKIVGNVGDQWNDISGDNVGDRTFKIPNPMYYVK